MNLLKEWQEEEEALYGLSPAGRKVREVVDSRADTTAGGRDPDIGTADQADRPGQFFQMSFWPILAQSRGLPTPYTVPPGVVVCIPPGQYS